MTDYRRYSYWLETAGDLTPRPRLDGSLDADVAIVGAGYSGLWTAYYLLKRDASLRIVVLEAEIAGFGASGRNGAWCSAHTNLSLDELARRYGVSAAHAVQSAMNETVDEVGSVARDEAIDIGYTKGGALHVARGKNQVPLAHARLDAARRVGLADQYELLTADEAAQHVQVSGVDAALFTRHCATIHPGRLVRRLAAAVERKGVTIYEGTPVTEFEAGPPRAIAKTPFGDVRARVVVLAGESYLTRLRPLHRQLIPIYSLIVLSEPLPAATWAEIGWERRECLQSFRLTIDYLSRTEDGRILFGGRGAPYRFASRMEDRFDRHAPTHNLLERMFREWFPAARGAAITHRWGGAVAAPRDWTPTFSFDPRSGIASARGYTGQGVATSNLGGRTLADLIVGKDTELTRLPYVNHRSPDWEPEPFRWLGVRFVQSSFARIDERAQRTGRAPSGRSLAERLVAH